ncbi:MAG: NAD-dependent dehydratase [Candidatus Levybacteria bacterium RIFCSPHIGHO2_01_FULL_37_17]|nr:MAG: NAD-dependent dehydratase [Candidatus Levybacteria bacterium RIFCSPHIGHO2_01_FULL_37_17]OGH37148.1 MAG: NAD-dependent dehydratase [Candidatus Levybacteria bacterium RIFCSPLOWO2_01_FULL_38_23]
METCLVAGGGGFIGSHLCESLLDENFRVICVDNFITGDKSNIKHLSLNKNFLLIEDDIIKRKEYDIAKTNYIFHLASPASPNLKSKKSYINFPLETLLVNSLGTYNLLEVALKSNAKFLYTSTSEVYGDPAISPQTETYFGNVNPNGIRSPYDESKRFGESITMTYFRKFNLDSRIIRIFNTYGPRMQKDDGRVVSNFINQALENRPITIYGDGAQTRSFCFVSDMVEGIKRAMFNEETSGEVINLGNPTEKSILDFAKLIIQLTQSSSELLFEELPQDDPKKRNPDITKAKKILNWEPKIELEKGIVKTIQYYKEL